MTFPTIDGMRGVSTTSDPRLSTLVNDEESFAKNHNEAKGS